jgi:hypothetical protein
VETSRFGGGVQKYDSHWITMVQRKKCYTNLTIVDQPCRLGVQLSGLEYLVFNNSYVYDKLEELRKKRGQDNTIPDEINVEDIQAVAAEAMAPVASYKLPWLYRYFPAIAFQFKNGCVCI